MVDIAVPHVIADAHRVMSLRSIVAQHFPREEVLGETEQYLEYRITTRACRFPLAFGRTRLLVKVPVLETGGLYFVDMRPAKRRSAKLALTIGVAVAGLTSLVFWSAPDGFWAKVVLLPMMFALLVVGSSMGNVSLNQSAMSLGNILVLDKERIESEERIGSVHTMKGRNDGEGWFFALLPVALGARGRALRELRGEPIFRWIRARPCGVTTRIVITLRG